MSGLHLAAQRRLFGVGLAGMAASATLWLFSPGLPVMWGPTAWASEKTAGRELFEHEWAANDPLAHGDGLGPVFNAKACVSCHFQGGVGGGGEMAHNAVGFELLGRPGSPEFRTGTIHNFSTNPANKESFNLLKKLNPTIKGTTQTIRGGDPHCSYTRTITTPDFDPVRTSSVNTTALFGAGWIDLISNKAITKIAVNRTLDGVWKDVHLDFTDNVGGRIRYLPDGRVGRFGWKAQFATLEEFVAAACANEIGLTTPYSTQATPIGTKAPAEVKPDLDKSQFRSLVAFVYTLPKPVETLPTSPGERSTAERGKSLFGTVGCAACHVPDVGGVNGVYSDFQLHVLDDQRPGGGFGEYGTPPLPEFPRPDSEPRPEEWKTPPLWGVADSAPYFHDGETATLADAINRHQGEAKAITAAYKSMPPADQQAVIVFLKTLKAPPDAIPVRDMAVTKIAKR